MDEGFNFRSTLAFVTDPANTQWADNDTTGLYPQTRAGVTFGWVADTEASYVDRDASGDARTSGELARNNTSAEVTPKFRVDLDSAGTYDIHVWAGARSYAHNNYWRILDNASVLDTRHVSTTVGANQMCDANGNFYANSAAIVSGAVPIRLTFSSTILILEIADPALAASSDTRIMHLRITSVASTGSQAIRRSDIMSGGMQNLQGGISQ
jgi:hypothetical protein